MTEQDKKILDCYKCFLRLRDIGADEYEIYKGLECFLEHGNGIEMMQLELEIRQAIEYRGTREYLNEQYRRREDLAKKLKEIDKLLASYAKNQEGK